ncbi:MAG: hypothetical protein LBG28_07480 [Tannerella sp.]|jgi:hypothetical protein|nr:hypothetical protein [Tannerella sp.]
MPNFDFLPRKEAEFYAWVIVFFTYLLANLSRFGISSSVISPLTSLRDDFMTKYNVAIEPSTRTKATVLAKNNAMNALKNGLRAFIREYLSFNHLVTDVDKDNLGLPIRKTSHTPIPIPTTYPWFMVDSSIIRVLIIHFRDILSEYRAKSFGVHGAEIKWGFSDTLIINPDDLPHSSFDTRSPFRLEFKGEERGKTVWFCLWWENTRGEKGPWSEIVSAIVP